MKKLKIKVHDLTAADLEDTARIQIRNAKAFFEARPFATKLYVSMKMGIPIEFIKKHWHEISGEKN